MAPFWKVCVCTVCLCVVWIRRAGHLVLSLVMAVNWCGLGNAIYMCGVLANSYCTYSLTIVLGLSVLEAFVG